MRVVTAPPRKVPVKMRLAAGDTVVVLSGRDKGKRGKIKLVRHDGTAEVEGVSGVKRHSKATPKAKAGIIEKEMPMPVGKLMFVCPKCNKPSKLAFHDSSGARERVCRRCGEPAERPVKA
jgi:large subunit ribosomal protein L24